MSLNTAHLSMLASAIAGCSAGGDAIDFRPYLGRLQSLCTGVFSGPVVEGCGLAGQDFLFPLSGSGEAYCQLAEVDYRKSVPCSSADDAWISVQGNLTIGTAAPLAVAGAAHGFLWGGSKPALECLLDVDFGDTAGEIRLDHRPEFSEPDEYPPLQGFILQRPVGGELEVCSLRIGQHSPWP